MDVLISPNGVEHNVGMVCGDGNYEWCRLEGFYFVPRRKFGHLMDVCSPTGLNGLSRCLQVNLKKAQIHNKRSFQKYKAVFSSVQFG